MTLRLVYVCDGCGEEKGCPFSMNFFSQASNEAVHACSDACLEAAVRSGVYRVREAMEEYEARKKREAAESSRAYAEGRR